MNRFIRSGVTTAALLGFLGTFLGTLIVDARADTTLVSIKTPRGATQSFILIKPEKPVASVILFAGGHGALGLKSTSSMQWGAGNFLVRSRDRFAAQGFMVAVIDAPSDRRQGMNAIFRMSRPHAQDIGAVVAYLKTQASVPVWLVGTSMGTFSAAGGAIGATGVDGLVLTSTITRTKPDWKIAGSHPNSVASMALGEIAVPALIVSHRHDGCAITPAVDAEKLRAGLNKAKAAEIVLLDGGDPPQSDPCEAKSQHGFLGIEGKAVGAIGEFIRKQGR
jgi:pimeloyl-ACP methyl ester carboxylesterase